MHDLRVSIAAESSVEAGSLAAVAAAIPGSELVAATQERLLVPTQSTRRSRAGLSSCRASSWASR